MARRYTKEQERAIVDAYAAWEPDEESVTDLCERLEISRQSLYTVLARNNIPLKGREGQVAANSGGIAKEMAAQALRVLIDEISTAKARIAELEAEVARLQRRDGRSRSAQPSHRTMVARSR